MILYANYGEKDYFQSPVPNSRRKLWEFQGFLSGSCTLTLEGGETRQIESPCLCAFKPDCIHGWRSESPEPVERFVIQTIEACELMEEVLTEGYYIVKAPVEELAVLNRKIREIEEQVLKPNYLSLHRYRILSEEIFICFFSHLEKSKISYLAKERREEQIVNAIVSWFLPNMHLGINMHHVSEKSGYSIGYIRHLFYKIKGMGPKQYFLSQQIKRADELLKENTLSIMQIALECGFKSHSVFCHIYRKHRKSPPGEFRKRHGKTKGEETLP